MSLELRRRLMSAQESSPIIIDARYGGVSGDAANDAIIMDKLYRAGLANNNQYLTQREAERVLNMPSFQNTGISNFSALQYFINAALPSNAFERCTSLKTVVLPTTLKNLPIFCFRYSNLIELPYGLPNGLLSIGNQAFMGCTNIKLLSLPEGITRIGEYTFQQCTSLALTTLPNNIETIGTNAFIGCSKLKLTSLPESLTTLGERALRNCTNVALTTLPSKLKYIGPYALTSTKITDIKILNTSEKIQGSTEMFNSGVTIRVPSDLLSAYQEDSNWNIYNLIGY